MNLAPGPFVSAIASRRLARMLLLAACGAALLLSVAAACVFRDARVVAGRNALLAAKVGELSRELRGADEDPEWQPLRLRRAFFVSALYAGGPGLSETLAALESSAPADLALREIAFSRRERSVTILGHSRSFDGGELFRKTLDRGAPGWAFALESTGYDQATRVYGFRLKGSWGPE